MLWSSEGRLGVRGHILHRKHPRQTSFDLLQLILLLSVTQQKPSQMNVLRISERRLTFLSSRANKPVAPPSDFRFHGWWFHLGNCIKDTLKDTTSGEEQQCMLSMPSCANTLNTDSNPQNTSSMQMSLFLFSDRQISCPRWPCESRPELRFSPICSIPITTPHLLSLVCHTVYVPVEYLS